MSRVIGAAATLAVIAVGAALFVAFTRGRTEFTDGSPSSLERHRREYDDLLERIQRLRDDPQSGSIRRNAPLARADPTASALDSIEKRLDALETFFSEVRPPSVSEGGALLGISAIIGMIDRNRDIALAATSPLVDRAEAMQRIMSLPGERLNFDPELRRAWLSCVYQADIEELRLLADVCRNGSMDSMTRDVYAGFLVTSADEAVRLSSIDGIRRFASHAGDTALGRLCEQIALGDPSTEVRASAARAATDILRKRGAAKDFGEDK